MGRSAAYTGSMTYDVGDGGSPAEDRWIYCAAGGQKSKTLTVAATGPSYPTRENIIKNDDADFDFIAVQIKVTKTVHTDALAFVGTNAKKEIYAWGGSDDFALGPLRYAGDGNGPCIIHCGQSTTPWANSRWDMTTPHLMQNSEGLNAENVSVFPLSPNPYTLLAGPFRTFGIHLHFRPIDGTAPTGPNTWSFEISFFTR